MSTKQKADSRTGRLVASIPVIMFAIFAGFYSIVDIVQKNYLFVLPSALILTALLVSQAFRKRDA